MCKSINEKYILLLSHLTRGAWIEINCENIKVLGLAVSHLTRGAWIEIKLADNLSDFIGSRTSHEVRGLKYQKE